MSGVARNIGSNVDDLRTAALPRNPHLDAAWKPRIVFPIRELSERLCREVSSNGQLPSRTNAHEICVDFLRARQVLDPVALYWSSTAGELAPAEEARTTIRAGITGVLARAQEAALLAAIGRTFEVAVLRGIGLNEAPHLSCGMLMRMEQRTIGRGRELFGGLNATPNLPSPELLNAYAPEIRGELESGLFRLFRGIPEISQRLNGMESLWPSKTAIPDAKELREIVWRFSAGCPVVEGVALALDLGAEDVIESLLAASPGARGVVSEPVRAWDAETLIHAGPLGGYHLFFEQHEAHPCGGGNLDLPSLVRHSIFLSAAIRLAAIPDFTPQQFSCPTNPPRYWQPNLEPTRVGHLTTIVGERAKVLKALIVGGVQLSRDLLRLLYRVARDR